MHPPEIPSKSKSIKKNELLYSEVVELMDTYLVKPSTYKDIFYADLPKKSVGSLITVPEVLQTAQPSEDKPTASHINIHREQYYLLKTCTILARVLQSIRLYNVANNTMGQIIKTYHKIFHNHPVDFKCSEDDCKEFASIIKVAVKQMEDAIA